MRGDDLKGVLERARPFIGDDNNDAGPLPSGNVRGPRYYNEGEK